MRYIPAKHKLARIWVETCMQSLLMEKDEACELYAKLCGFNTWSQVMLLIGNVPASPVDEVVDEKTLDERRSFYISTLCGEYKVTPRMAIYISSNFSPSSVSIPMRLSIDVSSLYKENESHVYLENRVSSSQAFSEGLRGSVDDAKNEITSDVIRSSRPVCPSNWYTLALHLGWDVIEGSCVKDYAFGEASFWLWSSQKYRIPVFILPFTRLPEDNNDVLASTSLRNIESSLSILGSQQAIVFWGGMLIKRIANFDYTYPGVVYRDGKWQNFLLNKKMTRVEDVFDFLDYVSSVDRPHPAYADKDRELAVSFFLMSEGVESPSDVNLFVTSSGSGWGGLISVKKY